MCWIILPTANQVRGLLTFRETSVCRGVSARIPRFTRRAGPYGSFLGHGYDPVWTEFEGQATQKAARVSFFSRLKDIEVADPFLGITAESRLRISKEAQLREGIDAGPAGSPTHSGAAAGPAEEASE